MSMAERVGRVMNRVYDRLRHKAAFAIRAEDATAAGDLESLRGQKYAVLVTFRRSGEAVPSPIWFGLDDRGRAYARTMHDAGKVKRIRNDPRVLIAASTQRGKPKGPVIAGSARVLPPEEWPNAEAALAAAYGLGRRIYEGALGGPEDLTTYIEVTAGSA